MSKRTREAAELIERRLAMKRSHLVDTLSKSRHLPHAVLTFSQQNQRDTWRYVCSSATQSAARPSVETTLYMMVVINSIHDGHQDDRGSDAYDGDGTAANLLDGGGDPNRRRRDRTSRDHPWESGHQACSTAPARSQRPSHRGRRRRDLSRISRPHLRPRPRGSAWTRRRLRRPTSVRHRIGWAARTGGAP